MAAIVTASQTFRDKYFALPGDMTNATAFWGAAATCPGVATTAAAGVCNGNGDGRIDPSITTSNEMYGLWEHLAAADLVEGTYTGNANSTTAGDQAALIGGNVPSSKMGNAGWSVIHVGNRAISETGFYEGNYGNVFYFGSGSQVSTAILKPEEAWNIDTKMDDGRPALGSVLSFENQGSTGATGCGNLAASSSVALTGSNYALTNTGTNCALIFKTGY
jgi:hypothetical protein